MDLLGAGSISPKIYYFLLVCAIAIISTDIHPVQGQRVDTDPRNITVLEGDKSNLLCRWGQPLQYCRIEVPGEKPLILSTQWDKSPGFKYFGDGLDKGQCGVTIEKISAANHGLVKCFLGGEGEEHVGVIDVTVALAPLRPELDVQSNSQTGIFEIDDQLHATCISRDGRPPANISWFLDDQPLTDGLGMVEIVESLASANTTLFTSSQSITRYLKASDDRKHLICRTSQIADRGQPQEVQIQLQVRFSPQPLAQVNIYGLILHTTAIINVTINANPRPRTEWIVDGVSIPQGTQNGRYESYEPIDLGGGIFNVSLSIASLSLEDTTKTFYLKASNDFGSQDYTIKISSSEAASTGLDIGSIVGIAVGVAILLIVILLIVVARITGKWCFAAHPIAIKSQPSETSDTESADVKTPKFKKYNLNLEGLFKKKPKIDDEEKNMDGADDQNDDAAPSEATVIIEDDPPRADEKSLVYAELMLKPSEDSNNPNKNATEYAEIVYVSPTPPTEQKTQEKK